MPAETPRIVELRRRVQSDPASIAFAQLAEEYRRAGNYDEAINCCRTGLARHPGYLSARVTLGRALTEVGGVDEAAREFELVLRTAPDNLAAIRGMAEIHQRRGELGPALKYYQRALALARHDPDLEETVSQIGRELAKAAPASTSDGMSFAEAQSELLSAASRLPERPNRDAAGLEATPGDSSQPQAATPVPPETAAARPTTPPIDFEALLRSLGSPDAAPPPVMAALLNDAGTPMVRPEAVLPELPAETASDPFAALESELRAFDDARSMPPPAAPPPAPSAPASGTTTAILDELEAWLEALVSSRGGNDHRHP